MRHHPRPFVVEVKRGTSRQSFQSHGPDSEKFSAAEKLLFSKALVEPDIDTASSPRPARSGRVLPVLSDVNEIVLADPFPTPRRGRPPGSKNKAKSIGPVLPREAPIPLAFGASEIADVEPETMDERHDARMPGGDEALLAPLLLDPPADSTAAPSRAKRLRDRSRILRRYVLGTEPKAGERKPFRKRKITAAYGKRER